MGYIVLARKYRPQTFEDFIGQEAVATTLANAIRTDRVAHAYLFCGPRGVGKTSMARVFAKALNCADGPTTEPCGRCERCRAIATGADVDVLEIDGASNRGIDEVREIRQNAKFAASRSRFKIYIIDEVHMLTEPAFNALLKTLEEPPGHVKFILATTAPSKLPETIHSRLQRFTFRRVELNVLTDHLRRLAKEEGVEIGEDVLRLVARQGRGSVRDALSMLDQVIAFCAGDPSLDKAAACLGALSETDLWVLADRVREGDAAGALETADAFLQRGVGIDDLLQQMTALFRDLLVVRHCGPKPELLGRTEGDAQAFAKRAEDFSPDAVVYMIQILTEAGRRIKNDLDARVILEMTLVKLCRHGDLSTLQELLDRLAEMEKRLTARGSGGAPQHRPPPRPGTRGAPGPEPPPPPRARPPEPEPPRAEAPPAPVPQSAEETRAYGAAPEDLWDKALAIVHERDSWAYLQISHASLAGFADGVATIEFPHELASSRQEAERASVRDLLADVFQGLSGAPTHVRFELASEAESEGVSQDAIRHDPIVRAALDIFDGRIVSIQRHASRSAGAEPAPAEAEPTTEGDS